MRVQEAKNFLVQEIAIEAQLEGTPLSDLERRMLYFTESEDATEDPAALNEQFEKEYDTAEYEKKISRLMSHAYRRSNKDSPEKLRLWNEAFSGKETITSLYSGNSQKRENHGQAGSSKRLVSLAHWAFIHSSYSCSDPKPI